MFLSYSGELVTANTSYPRRQCSSTLKGSYHTYRLSGYEYTSIQKEN
jgi:hypothetical protein